MNLADIQPAIASIQANPKVEVLRARTYLLTYPHILAFASAQGVGNQRHFYQLALMIYAWMPRIIQIDPEFLGRAICALGTARDATVATYPSIRIVDIAECLHSVIGASKLLHFVNPDVFPIWDSNIQKFCGVTANSKRSVAVHQYLHYVMDVHAIIKDPGFPGFFASFDAAYSNRLKRSVIPVYQVGPVRAVEAAAFELA